MPIVTVICICYNHKEFVAEAINSVLNQTYNNIQLIVIDNGSADKSAAVIKETLSEYQEVLFIESKENLGHCAGFNLCLESAQGKYIIDLSADDVLLPQRIEKQVSCFEQLPISYGVIFSDTYLISENGKNLGTYHKRSADGKLLQTVPFGNIYQELIKRAFLSTPTMMMRFTMLQQLNGYDETLSYEDYDIWVRSGREFHYYFQDEILTKKRVVSNSSGSIFFRKTNNPHLESTLKVCRKALFLNQNKEEDVALSVSVRYHLRLSFFTENFHLVIPYANLLVALETLSFSDKIILQLSKYQLKTNKFYQLFLFVRKLVSL